MLLLLGHLLLVEEAYFGMLLPDVHIDHLATLGALLELLSGVRGQFLIKSWLLIVLHHFDLVVESRVLLYLHFSDLGSHLLNLGFVRRIRFLVQVKRLYIYGLDNYKVMPVYLVLLLLLDGF